MLIQLRRCHRLVAAHFDTPPAVLLGRWRRCLGGAIATGWFRSTAVAGLACILASNHAADGGAAFGRAAAGDRFIACNRFRHDRRMRYSILLLLQIV